EIAYFVHISDTHIGPTADYARHGHAPLPCAQKVVQIINTLPVKPDFVMHTGDIVTDPDPAAYRLAAKTFSQLQVPIYYVTGNHDTARDIHRSLPMGPKRILSMEADVLSYSFDVKGYRFLVIDARGPDEIDPHGILSESQLDLIRKEVAEDGPPLVFFLHFPSNILNSTWMDAYMLIINGEKLHEALLPARDRIRGVFYGHTHQNMQTLRDGILYVSVASTFSQFTAWPTDIVTGFDAEHPPGFNFVHLLPQQTIIHQHLFQRPE
ncbi:MAG: hypothetical protein GY943_32020, partial [Chloroflexi bacterium]|nr:hypothetical protein [Chloroflexota bacterium]